MGEESGDAVGAMPRARLLIAQLESTDALRFGDFVLASGRRSSYYVDVKQAVTRPDVLQQIVRLIRPHAEGYHRIAGTELGAIPLAVALALEISLPYVMVRKESHAHGMRRALEGELHAGDRVLLVEDVTTTGSSVARAIQILREKGAVVDRVVCVVDRDEGAEEALEELGVKLLPLVRSKDLLDAARE